MLKKSTTEILQVCKEAIEYYDPSFHEFFGKPNKETINRKIEFLLLLSKLDVYQPEPEEAFIKVFDFYISQKPSCRITGLLQSALINLLNLQPKRTGQLYVDAQNSMLAIRLLHESAQRMKKKLGIENDKNSLLLTTITQRYNIN